MLQNMVFYHLLENIKKQLLNIGLNTSEKVVHKAGDLLGNKIEGTVTKSNDHKISNKNLLKK